MNVAQSLINSGVEMKTLDVNDFKSGFDDMVSVLTTGSPAPKLKGDEANRILTDYFNKIEMESKKALKLAGEKYLEANTKQEGVVTLPSGLQYKVLKEGTGGKPDKHSTVKVHYEGSLINGQVFDSSYKRGEPISFNLQGVIKGWTEGLQLMPIGSTYEFYIPYNLAYGEQGTGPIPPYSTLIFKVELLGIL